MSIRTFKLPILVSLLLGLSHIQGYSQDPGDSTEPSPQATSEEDYDTWLKEASHLEVITTSRSLRNTFLVDQLGMSLYTSDKPLAAYTGRKFKPLLPPKSDAPALQVTSEINASDISIDRTTPRTYDDDSGYPITYQGKVLYTYEDEGDPGTAYGRDVEEGGAKFSVVEVTRSTTSVNGLRETPSSAPTPQESPGTIVPTPTQPGGGTGNTPQPPNDDGNGGGDDGGGDSGNTPPASVCTPNYQFDICGVCDSCFNGTCCGGTTPGIPGGGGSQHPGCTPAVVLDECGICDSCGNGDCCANSPSVPPTHGG